MKWTKHITLYNIIGCILAKGGAHVAGGDPLVRGRGDPHEVAPGVRDEE